MGTKIVPAGNVLEAKFASGVPSFIRPTNYTGSRLLGKKYEEKALSYLQRCAQKDLDFALKSEYLVGPWLIYNSQGDSADYVRYCQPDFLLKDHWQKKITIVEVKLQHCIEAYEQLTKLYKPVVQKIFPNYDISLCEVVQWYDPHIRFPETFYFEEHPLRCEIDKIAIHIYNPRYDPLAKKGSSKKEPASATQLNRSPPLG